MRELKDNCEISAFVTFKSVRFDFVQCGSFCIETVIPTVAAWV
jgi:hypothetical protein